MLLCLPMPLQKTNKEGALAEIKRGKRNMFRNFITDYEDWKKNLYRDEMEVKLADWLEAGKNCIDFIEEHDYDDWYFIDMVTVDVAAKLGWDYSKYKNNNTYDENSENETQNYNDERSEIVDAAIAYIDEIIRRKEE